MALLVQKYGGTSVGTTDRILEVARRIAAAARRGDRLVVVVSAMADTTDDLLALARRIHDDPPARELDMLLTAGERIAMALVCMALHRLGADAVSFTGSQSGILTDDQHADARIREVRGDRIREALDAGRTVLVAGFQGVRPRREVTTLGRGGSDTSAVALAAALGAARCEIYTDVDGVCSADPRVVAAAHRIPELSYAEMLEFAARGARVLHPRSVEVGWRFGVPIHVLSSFVDGMGTVIRDMQAIESGNVRGVTCDAEVALLEARGTDAACGAALLDALGKAGVRTLLVVQSMDGSDGRLAVLVPRDVASRGEAAWRDAGSAARIARDADVAAVAVVGHAVQSQPGTAGSVVAILAREAIPVRLVASAALGLTCVVPRADADRAVRALHAGLGLETS